MEITAKGVLPTGKETTTDSAEAMETIAVTATTLLLEEATALDKMTVTKEEAKGMGIIVLATLRIALAMARGAATETILVAMGTTLAAMETTDTQEGHQLMGSRFSKPGRPAGRRPGNRNEAYFTAADEAGINQMLSTKPQISESAELSDNDIVKTPIKEEIRLNKYIANSGICSRREADNFIQAGVVTVNGEVVTRHKRKRSSRRKDCNGPAERLQDPRVPSGAP